MVVFDVCDEDTRTPTDINRRGYFFDLNILLSRGNEKSEYAMPQVTRNIDKISNLHKRELLNSNF